MGRSSTTRTQTIHLTIPRLLLATSLLILTLSLLPSSIRIRLLLLGQHLFPVTAIPTPTMSTTASRLYSVELRTALLAVQRAARLTSAVYNATVKGTTSKSDASPVTIGDFGAQALIIAALKHKFPADDIVAEEEASELRVNSELRNDVWHYVSQTRLDDDGAERELGGSIASVEDMMDAIDQGKSPGGAKGRIWAIDPIDG